MSIYKVERKVDTVIVEMDVSIAEKLAACLNTVLDKTGHTHTSILSDMAEFRRMLAVNADVRVPSPLYIADARDGYTILRNTTPVEADLIRDFLKEHNRD